MTRRNRPGTASARQRVAAPPIKFAQKHDANGRTRTKKGGLVSSLTAFGIRVAVFYTVFAALWHCPSRPFAFDYSVRDARPVCRNIAQAHQQLAPILSPYIHQAKDAVEPYTKPALDAVSPYVDRAWSISRPYCRSAQRRSKLIYKKHIDPVRKNAIKSARAQVDPLIKKLHAQYSQHVQPRVDLVQRQVKPYQDIYRRDVSPYVQQAYRYSLQSSSVSYAFYLDKVHPRVIQALQHLHRFLVHHVNPALRRFYSLYVRPQGEKFFAKLYEQKAHWMGSDAIKAAEAGSHQAAKDADAQSRAAVKAATHAAVKAQEDPSLAYKLKQVKDAVLGGKQDTDPIEAAKLDAELDAEEAKVKEQLEVWEDNMGALIEKEYRLAIERLIDLRNRAMADLPDRFGAISEVFVEDQVALILSRIDRGLRKLARREAVDERLAEGQDLISQQLARLDQASTDIKVQVAEFYEQLLSQERQVIETSYQEIARFAEAAKTAYGKIMADSKFAVTMDDWQGWDKGVRKRAGLYLEDLSEVQRGERRVNADSGAPDLQKEAPNLAPEVAALRKFSERLFVAARRQVESFGDSGLAQLRGDGIMTKFSDVADSIADQASSISLEAASVMLEAAASARSKLGFKEPDMDKGYFARAKAQAQLAVESAGDAMGSAATSAGKAYGSIGESLASFAGQAQSVVVDAAAAVPSSASSYASDASSALHSITRGLAFAADASVTPDSEGHHAQKVKDSAAVLASDVASHATAAVSAGAASGANIVGAASSAIHQATRSVASALGAHPTPESAAEYVASASAQASTAASSVASGASDAVVDARFFIMHGQVSESVASAYSVAEVRAAAAYSDVASVGEGAASQIAEAVSRATVSAASVASISTAPTGVADHASSAAGVVGSKLSEASVTASSLAHEASKVGAIALGGTPKPDTINEHADRIIVVAQDQAAEGLNGRQRHQACRLAHLKAASAYSSQFVDPAFKSIGDAVQQATRSVLSAAGATPAPEGIREHVEYAGKKVEEMVREAVAKVRDEL